MSLLGLPNELLLQIASYLEAPHLNALLQANRRMAWLLTPTLYDLASKPPQYPCILQGESVLHWASERGYETPVRLLIERGSDILLHYWDTTALHAAAEKGHVGVVRLFMEHKAAADAINIRDRRVGGLTPLHVAAENGHAGVVRVMLEHGADSEMLSSKRATALHCACMVGHEAVVAVLVENGCQVNIEAHPRTIFGSTLLHWLAEFCCWVVMYKGRDPSLTVELLLGHGGDASVEDSHGRSPLHYAARNGEPVFFRRISDVPVQDPNLKRRQAREAHSRVLRLLVKYGANVNAIDKNGRTALHDAAENTDEHSVITLLELGADPKMETDSGKTALQSVIKFRSRVGAKKIISVLQKHERSGAERTKEARKASSPTGSLEELQSHGRQYVLVMGEDGEERWTQSESRPKSMSKQDLEATSHSQSQKTTGNRHKRWLSRVLHLGSKKS